MDRRTALKTMGVGIAALTLPGTISAMPASRKPNVLLIISDDAGYGDFGMNGCTDVPTPNIDALAKAGVRCPQGYVSASVCAPSRAGLITGRYQQRFGHEFNGPSAPLPGYTQADMGLDPREKTIGDTMKAAGYRTMALGKWHLGDQEQFHPLNRGFDEFYGFLGGSRSYFPLANTNKTSALRRGDTPVDEESEVKYLTDDLTTVALEFINRKEKQPFFVYLAYNAVHTPMNSKPEIEKRFEDIKEKQRRTYAAMTASLDENVGRVAATLKNLKLEQNTLVMFINDNGGATNNGSDNGKLRGMKGSKWEGGIRVPYFFTWPGTLPAGQVFDKPIISLDLLPTAAAAGGGKPIGNKPDGVNLLPFLKGEEKGEPHEILFWRRGVASAVRKGPWKIIRSKSNPTLLFNLNEDESETVNLAEKHPEITKSLLNALANWEKELAPPKWTEGKVWETNQIMKHQMRVTTRAMERKYP